MARTSLVKTTALGSYGDYSVANSADLTMAAGDVANKNQFAATGDEVVIAHNTNGSAQTITVTSSPDPYGRTKDISAYSIGAGEYAVFGPFELTGWVQTDGKVYLEVSHADVKLGVVKLP
jgi:hypothetical protein